MALQKLFQTDFLSFLDRKHSIASPSFNRWFLPPAALAIQMSIGFAYGFSVFWLPLSNIYGVKCKDMKEEFFSTKCDWQVSSLVYTYSLFFFCYGMSSAVFGKWLERVGPRKAGFVAAICWSVALMLGALGIYLHQILVLWIGCGVIGGIGIGIGYISPVSTLIKWFPDKRGMATGMAIMGFGGGAIVGAPLATKLMHLLSEDPAKAVPRTLMCLSAIYFVFMACGAMSYRLPPAGWVPKGFRGTGASLKGGSYYSFSNVMAAGHVHVDKVHLIPQFWLVWVMVLTMVTAGVSLLGLASVVLQEEFGGHLIGKPNLTFEDLVKADKKKTAAVGAAFVGFVSIFNICGRLGYGILSDRIGRKATLSIFFCVGAVLYALLPLFGRNYNLTAFTIAYSFVISFYGGNYALLPALLADLFGTQFVGAIHGRVLTTLCVGAILGPTMETTIHDAQIRKGVPPKGSYDMTMYVLAGFLCVGQICNMCIRPINAKYFMTEEELDAVRKEKTKTSEDAEEKAEAGSTSENSDDVETSAMEAAATTSTKKPMEMEKGGAPQSVMQKFGEYATLGLAWGVVMVPFGWGVAQTLMKAMYLF